MDEIRDWGATVATVLRPQISRRPMRFRLLREFLTYATSFPDPWTATGEGAAAHRIRHEQRTAEE